MTRITLISPFDFAFPEKWVTIDPSLFHYVGLSSHAKASQKRSTRNDQAKKDRKRLADRERREKAGDAKIRRSLDLLLLPTAHLDVGGVRHGARSTKGKKARLKA